MSIDGDINLFTTVTLVISKYWKLYQKKRTCTNKNVSRNTAKFKFLRTPANFWNASNLQSPLFTSKFKYNTIINKNLQITKLLSYYCRNSFV